MCYNMEHIPSNLILFRQNILPSILLLNVAVEWQTVSLRIWEFPGSNFYSETDELLSDYVLGQYLKTAQGCFLSHISQVTILESTSRFNRYRELFLQGQSSDSVKLITLFYKMSRSATRIHLHSLVLRHWYYLTFTSESSL
jgi:hypothetical protein